MGSSRAVLYKVLDTRNPNNPNAQLTSKTSSSACRDQASEQYLSGLLHDIQKTMSMQVLLSFAHFIFLELWWLFSHGFQLARRDILNINYLGSGFPSLILFQWADFHSPNNLNGKHSLPSSQRKKGSLLTLSFPI